MSKYINPFTDWGFKKIFGQEINADLLIGFLNELLKGERHITEVTFLDKEQIPEYEDDRALIYDVYCTTDTGEKIIVEMQNKRQKYFVNRTLYYMSRAIINQGEKGDDWMYDIKAVYGIFFMNFTLADLAPTFRVDGRIEDMQTHEAITDKMRYIYLQLPLFHKEEQDDCENDFERWIFILKHMETLDRMPFTKSKVFERLAKIADVRSLTEEEKFQYDESLKHYRDSNAVLRTAVEDGFEEGRAQGHEEGRKEGRAEGETIGEKKKSHEIARKMKENGMSVEIIQQMTGLSAEEIQNL